MGLSWNMLSGYSGMISFGQAAFFGLGGYTMTIAFVKFGVTPWLGIPLGVLVGVIAAVIIGIPTFRLRGHYFALSMLAYPLAMLYVFEWLGYQEVSLPMMRENPVAYAQFQDPRTYMALAMVMLVAAMILSLHVERSRFGRSLLAIKQNEPAAEAAGIDAPRQKMYAIMLSGAIAAAAGGLYANVLLVVTPQTMFGMLVSAQALIVSLFGGVGVFWGPVIGAAVLVPLAEILHGELGHIIPGIQGVVYGLAIIVIILLAPEGIYWKLRDRFAPVRRPPTVPRVAAAPAPAAARPAADAPPVLTLDRVTHAFGGLQGRRRREPRGQAGFDPRHHRAERRRQDDALQRHQRVSRARRGRHPVRRRRARRPEAAPGLPTGHRPHVPGRARVPAHDRARERDHRRLRRRRRPTPRRKRSRSRR